MYYVEYLVKCVVVAACVGALLAVVLGGVLYSMKGVINQRYGEILK
jgi:hypothetical protein